MDFSKYNFNALRIAIHQVRLFQQADEAVFNEKLKLLLEQKKEDPSFRKQLSEFTYLLLDNAFFVNAFADYGIHSNRGFFAEVYLRFKHKLLPPKTPANELSRFIVFLFDKPKDALWLQKVSYENWELLFSLNDTSHLNEHSEKIAEQLHNAIIILSQRLTAIGIDPYLVGKYPEADDSNSPFFALNHAVSLFVRKHLHDKTLEVDHAELQAVLLLLSTCEKIFDNLRDGKDTNGTSLHLTFLIRRAQQHIARIRLLLHLYVTRQHSNKILSTSQLLTELVKAEHGKNSIRRFIADNSALVAYRVVSHTSEKGEHYIGFSRSENRKLLYSAMGGGLVVVLLVYIKHFIHHLHLSLFFEGLMFGLNYGLGFVFMHLMHLTLATKQPAMTASYIAGSIESHPGQAARPWIVFRQIMRSQFLSLIGNLVVVLPLCFLSAYALRYFFDLSVFNQNESLSQLYSNHPLLSASLIYAFFTGIFLSLSGIITGYVDNKVVFSEIADRIVYHPALVKVYTKESRQRLAAFVERHLGAILGNLFLGFCLGMAGSMGKFFGLPFDIRHITISAGNFGIALGSTAQLGLGLIITVFVGVLLIGTVNIISSFLISFVLACRSRNLSVKQSLRILFPFLPDPAKRNGKKAA